MSPMIGPTPEQGRELALPGVIAQGGRRGWTAALVAGVLFGGVTLIIPALLSREDALGFLAILLAMIGAVYLAFVLQDGRRREFGIEYVGMVVFTVLAMVGLAREQPMVLAAGYLGHGLWDIMHGPRGIHTRIPWWYAPLCLGFDGVLGAYMLIRFL
jgi:hypothetical protein